MFETLVKAFKIKEIRVKIWYTLLFLFIYRLGCYIPVPGIGSELITADTLAGDNVTYLNIMNMMTGGSLQNGTLFAMGIGPYINASIIIQLLAVAIPALERLSKQGEEGRKKISQYTRYLTIVLAVVQAIGLIVNYKTNLTASDNATPLANMLFGQKWLAYAVVVFFYTAGTVITMWIGERITDYGISNGISLLIFAGIIATAGQTIIQMFKNIGGDNGLVSFWKLIAMLVALIVIFTCIVTVELAERKIPVQYAKVVRGNKMYGGQSTVIPIKVNSNGVLPLIFAFSILSFPELIITLFKLNATGFGIWWGTWMGSNSWLYMVLLSLLIVFFAYFYTSIQFNPDDISKSIQQNGGFIMGIRPGKPTAEYLKKISGRITLFGAIFLALVALIPSLIFKAIDASSYGAFTATGMLIVVSVALEFNTALESQIMMKNYKGFLK